MAENKVKKYREKYKKHYNIDFDGNYAIHHIDGNHENNDISNLVLLPSKLHSKYHYQKQIIEEQKVPTKISGNSANNENYYLNCIEEFIETLKECNQWYDYKMFLEGRIPNIHGITL